MKTWIFQAHPDQFDLGKLLASAPSRMMWLVRRYVEQMAVGDDVYLWLAKGKSGEDAAIIASATIVSPVAAMPDDEASRQFWKVEGAATKVEDRVWIRLKRIAPAREQIKRDWLKDDPVLESLLILKQASGTNFPVTAPQSTRLGAMWERTGRDWNYAESVAGLWAYKESKHESPSMRTGSPVSRVALLTGRALSASYNKVMNFRSIDPNDSRKGLSGLGATGKRVWEKFFNSASRSIDESALDAEFERLWGTSAPSATGALEVSLPADSNDVEDSMDVETQRLAARSLADLMSAYLRGRQEGESSKPRRYQIGSAVFERDALVVAIAKRRADFRCEVPGCVHPPFLRSDGTTYCEVHHLVPLAEDGDDTIENAACLCPHHHREIHFGVNWLTLTASLQAIRMGGGDTPNIEP